MPGARPAGTTRDRPTAAPRLRQEARRFLTSLMLGLVAAEPSGKSSVGTVWLPSLTSMTNATASGSSSMFTSVNGMPSRPICALRRLQ